MSEKAWTGRFKEKNDELFERMQRSLPFDVRLFREDIKLNKVYSAELNKLGIIDNNELNDIIKGLDELETEIEEKGINIFPGNTEDIHMGVESLLAEKIGDAAKKIHAGKSRNDQVATDVRMYLISEIENLLDILKKLLKTLIDLSEDNISTIMPGYTHLRQAQPVLFSHYIMSFFFSLSRDYSRLKDSLKRVSIMPLGSAALAGSGFKLDRHTLKEELGFSRISENSMDAVLSRDFMLEFMSDVSILSITLTRLAEDFIIFSSENFNFFKLSDKVTTGSSIMPNKKNPDSLELVRGKSGRILGNFVALFTVLKSLPTTYNKDLQEDKENLFDTIDTIKDILIVTNIVMKTLEIDSAKMEDSVDPLSFATELADYLTLKNMPFRNAHHTVGKIVLDCIENKIKLTSLEESDLIKYSEYFKGIGDNWFDINVFLSKREIHGGTGVDSVKNQITIARDFLKNS